MKDLTRFHTWLIDEMMLKPDSADLYVTDVRIALDYTGGPVTFLKNWGDGLAPKTLQHYLAALRAWAAFREDGDLIKKLGKRMARLLPEATVKTPKQPFTVPEWRRFVEELRAAEYLDEPLRAAIGFMASRGVRVGDVLRLDRRTAREAMKASSFYITTKRNKRLEIETDEVRDYLAAFLSEGAWDRVEDLISARSDPERRRDSASLRVYRAVKRVAESAGLDPDKAHPHKLRRTVAANFLDEVGGDMTQLMDYMGWTSVTVAHGYVKDRDRARLRKAAKRMRDRMEESGDDE